MFCGFGTYVVFKKTESSVCEKSLVYNSFRPKNKRAGLAG
jgi:hypothetical protein